MINLSIVLGCQVVQAIVGFILLRKSRDAVKKTQHWSVCILNHLILN